MVKLNLSNNDTPQLAGISKNNPCRKCETIGNHYFGTVKELYPSLMTKFLGCIKFKRFKYRYEIGGK